MRSVLAMAVLALFVGCGHSHDEDTTCVETTAISISDYKFTPSCAIVASGATVTFTNQGHTTHTATTDDGQSQTFDSDSLAVHGTFDVAVTDTGAIKGHCNFHPSMHFTLHVQ